MSKNKQFLFIVQKQDSQRLRLDQYLSNEMVDFSRSQIQKLIKSDLVTVDQTVINDISFKLKDNQSIAVSVPEPKKLDILAQDIPLDILYEDKDLIVINKPAHLVVHPAPGHDDNTLVNALLAHCGDTLSGIGGEMRPGIVHRLDKETSGVMVIAKNDKAHQGLSEQFSVHSIGRAYYALVWGVPSPLKGTIESFIGRHPKDRKKMAPVKRGGRKAVTHYHLIKSFYSAISLIDCQLETGRTHQIRVHMTSLGHNIVGDKIYGKTKKNLLQKLPPCVIRQLDTNNRQLLHAYLLEFIHPIANKKLKFKTNIPEEISLIIRDLEGETL